MKFPLHVIALLALVWLWGPPLAAREKAEKGPSSHKSSRVKPVGERGKRLMEESKKQESSRYTRWKRTLPFWARKSYLLAELSFFIIIGVLIAQMLEVSGIIRHLAILAWPITKLGGLSPGAAPAFLMSFQSGAVANTMLVSNRDEGEMDNRQLYTSVLVVSCFSLFAHLPSFVVPIGAAFGWRATLIMFGVRFAAIVVQIAVILLISRLLVAPWMTRRVAAVGGEDTIVDEPTNDPGQEKAAPRPRRKDDPNTPFWTRVWKRSARTIRRLLIYLVPTYVIMSFLEYKGMFKWLAETVPGLFKWPFLPAESAAIIPAQAVNMYNGAIAAANFIDSGAIDVKQAVLVILIGSVITSPIRTLKHAIPTYVAVLGPRPGMVLAILAQVLRSIFLIIATIVMWVLW